MFTLTTKRRYGARIVAAAALAAAGLGWAGNVPAGAQNCSLIVVYSEPGVGSTGNYANFQPDPNKDFVCTGTLPRGNYDLRIIHPGSTMVMVRVFGGANPGPLTLSGLINEANITMTLSHPPEPLVSNFYDSPWIRLNPLTRGTLTATVARFYGSNTYHTID